MNRLRACLAALLATVFLSGATALAAPIQFDLRAPGIEDVDEVASFTLTDAASGLAATLTANNGVLNRTNAAFGINAENTGDNTTTIDGVLVAELVTITFNQEVLVNQVQLSLYTPHLLDQAALKFGSFAAFIPPPTTSADDVYDFTTDNYVGVGETVTVGWVASNGFSLDNFSVTPTPEPGTIVLFGVALLGAWVITRRRVP